MIGHAFWSMTLLLNSMFMYVFKAKNDQECSTVQYPRHKHKVHKST